MQKLKTVTTEYSARISSKVKEGKNMDDIIYINNEEAIILNFDTQCKLPIKGAFFIEGEYCYLNDENEYEPDFSLTVFYKDGEKNAANYICFEQDPPEIAYHNMKQKIMDAVVDHNDRVA